MSVCGCNGSWGLCRISGGCGRAGRSCTVQGSGGLGSTSPGRADVMDRGESVKKNHSGEEEFTTPLKGTMSPDGCDDGGGRVIGLTSDCRPQV